MAFDMGFDFRNTLGYVTDPAYGVFVTHTDSYPTTYTNGNGYSINGGYTVAPASSIDRVSTNDPRIAGQNYVAGTPITPNFLVDLSSGSAPGAGDYTVDIAGGDPGTAFQTDFELRDTATVLVTTSGKISLAANHFIDATITDVTATTTWTGTPVSKTFATTACNLLTNIGLDIFIAMSHFRLTLEGGGVVATIQEHIGRGIGRGIFVGR